jgi:exopolysaccharide biosynthesis polyprenyl glycosylphosphotransferase
MWNPSEENTFYGQSPNVSAQKSGKEAETTRSVDAPYGPQISALGLSSRPDRGEVITVLSTLIADVIGLTVAIFAGQALFALFHGHNPHTVVQGPSTLIFVGSFVLGLALFGSYHYESRHLVRSFISDLHVVAVGLGAGIIFSLALNDLLGGEGHRELRVEEAATFAAIALVLLPVFRAISHHLVLGRAVEKPRVLIVGSGKVAALVESRLWRSGDATIVGMVDDNPKPLTSGPVLGGLRDLPRLVDEHKVDRVLVAFSTAPADATLAQLQKVERQTSVSVVPQMYEMINFRSTVDELAGIPLVNVAPASLSRTARASKRLLDIVGSTIGIVLLLPFWIIVGILIKLDSPGPVFFRQARPGLYGKHFKIFKFRTMGVDAEARRQDLAELNEHADTPLFKIKSDPRVTKRGRYLRDRHLDELPQLFNVFLGQMSLVGPRPFPVAECGQLDPRRFEVKPGMTGLWQVCGRIDLSYEDLLHLDHIYVASWSFWWDLRILLQTPKVFIDGAADGAAEGPANVTADGAVNVQNTMSAMPQPLEAE